MSQEMKKEDFRETGCRQRNLLWERKVTQIMLALGIPANIKGYQYLREGILLSMDDMEMVNYITKLLYPCIAERYKTTSSRVERSIRHAIEVAWNRGSMGNIDSILGYHVYFQKEKPTNSEFIAVIADMLRLQQTVAS